MEEVDILGDGILDRQAVGILFHQPQRFYLLVIGYKEGGFFVTESHDGDLAHRPLEVAQGNR